MQLNLLIQLNILINSGVNIHVFVRVHHTKFFEINLTTTIIVNGFEYTFEVFNRQVDTREFTSGNELLEAQSTVKVDIKGSECLSVVSKFLLNSCVDARHHILDVSLFFIGHLSVKNIFLLRRFDKAIAQTSNHVWIEFFEVKLDCVFQVAGVGPGLSGEHRALIEYMLE